MSDFFCSRGSLIVAGILLLAGCTCFFNWREDADSAKREKTTVGVIDGVSGGRHGATYYYEFEVDGVRIDDESSSCRTALTPKECKVGAQVLVYYDHNPALRSKLKEFGAVSNDDFAIGSCFVFGAFMVTLMHFLSRRVIGSDDDTDDDDSDSDGGERGRPSSDQPDDLHVVPDK
jgi:hypothetical protein